MMRSQWIFCSFVDVWYVYLETHGHSPEPGQRGRPSQKRNIGSRYAGINHVIVKEGNQTRCAECHKITFQCEKCDVTLHVKCSVEYHTE